MIVSKKPSELGIPKEFEIPQVNIYGCPEGLPFGSISPLAAHTHVASEDPYFKNVCFIDPRHIVLPSGAPSDLLYHEYAHVIALTDGHGKEWEKVLDDLGRPDIRGPMVYILNGIKLVDILTREYWILEGIGLYPEYRRLGEVA